ncbi:bifunctional 2-polyprenyl-6-hydroxyphenol methylase/3-demethylubiquinol 3-O-methyltransferase UbiG [Pseudonocardia sp. MH-G8]|uniref:class I SAM-dependent methyltransferase n=1 Tax=Pseudonocardia sp. MH-G8 TaxID=1854588 RepID=UPI000BA101FD|nr:class I SAM-dependent methyltransferase [Pseudonocardia sp. MH-G8]OZM81994.1 SAM-dependent methyltransferase [Pseudonocardia sp. MH-G8]
MADLDERWNHNIHYHPVVLGAVPPGCHTALDVGCGEGMLTRELRAVVPSVTGIDLDAPSLELARAQDDGVEYVRGDVLTHPFAPASFDLVASIAVLHHMDTATALRRMRELLRPGGVLAVVGLPRHRLPYDLPYVLAGAVAHRWHRRRRSYWEHSAPTVWPPPDTVADVRRTAERELPGARLRRHALWRYSLVWTKPAA